MKWNKRSKKKPRIVEGAEHIVLPEVTTIGIQIAKLDRAAWRGTDALNAINPDPDRMQFFIPYQDGDVWRVAFGRLADDASHFLTAYEAYGDITKSDPFKVEQFEEPRQDQGWLLQACLAIKASQKVFPFHPMSKRYNQVVLREEDGGASVYWYPGTTNPNIKVFGADGVVHVRGEKDVEVVRYHKNLMQQPRSSGDSILTHTHMLIQKPVPLDVAYVLMSVPPEPSIILCEKQTYVIWKDGSIVALPQQS
jgi:hypothetical protein